MQHSSSVSSSKMLLHSILHADHARKWNTRLIIWCISTTHSDKRLVIMMKKWEKRKSDVHYWIIKYNYEKMISVLTNVSEKMYKAHCLIDSEIERNFILQSWVKEHELSKNYAILKQIQMIDDHWIFCYDMHQINIKLIDHEKVCKSWNIEFHAVNMQEYDMILDYSWLDEIDLNIHWREHCWSYWENSTC